MNFQELLPPFIFLLFLLWLIGRVHFFSLSGVHVRWLQLAFVLKVSAGIVMFYLYTYYYPLRIEADTFKYFDDSKPLYDALWSNPPDFFKILFGINCENDYFFTKYYVKMNNWYLAYDNGLMNDGRLIIRLNAVLRIISFGNYHINNMLFNMLSFIGLYSLMLLFIKISASKWKSYLAAFFVPSTIFWSSGILKENVLIFALGLFCLMFYMLIYESFKWKTLIITVFLISILMVVKLYVLLALLTAGTVFILATREKSNIMPFIISLVVFFLLLFIVELSSPTYSIVELVVQKQNDFIALAQRSSAGSYIPTPKLENNPWSLISNLPLGILNCFTRPWPHDIHSVLFIPPVIENILILGLILAVFIKRQGLNTKQKAFVLFSICFTLILFAIIGLTTPIIGAMVRYKVPALPFLFFSLMLLLRTKALDQRFEPLVLNPLKNS